MQGELQVLEGEIESAATPEMMGTSLKKLVILVRGLVLVNAITIPVIGMLQHELLGYMAFGLLVISTLVNVTTLLSYGCSPRDLRFAKHLWVGVAVAILGFTFYLWHREQHGDIALILVWAMYIHTFPVSTIVSYCLAGVSYWLCEFCRGALKVGYAYIAAVWLLYFVTGYLQWFRVIPALRRIFVTARKQ